MNWLFEQLPAWAEILLGFGFLILALFLEDWIDQWRGRQRGGWVDRAVETLRDRHDG